VLDAFEKIHQTMQANLNKMFTYVPKTMFEIRQTEAFRAASASAEYNRALLMVQDPYFLCADLDATAFNTTSGMESLFLHEAIPGHHYQISLQQEILFAKNSAASAATTLILKDGHCMRNQLGKELDCIQILIKYGALGDEMHRAIRLVVDVAIHTKGMTREKAINT